MKRRAPSTPRLWVLGLCLLMLNNRELKSRCTKLLIGHCVGRSKKCWNARVDTKIINIMNIIICDIGNHMKLYIIYRIHTAAITTAGVNWPALAGIPRRFNIANCDAKHFVYTLQVLLISSHTLSIVGIPQSEKQPGFTSTRTLTPNNSNQGWGNLRRNQF